MKFKTRHPPPRPATSRANDIFLGSKTPFSGAITRILRGLELKKLKYVHVYGMGRATQLVLAVAMELMERGHKVEVRTLATQSIDEQLDEDEGSMTIRARHLGGIELTVFGLNL